MLTVVKRSFGASSTLVCMSTKSCPSMAVPLMALMGMQDGLVLPTTFTGWRDVVLEIRQERAVEALRLEMAKMKKNDQGRRAEVGKKALTAMLLMPEQHKRHVVNVGTKQKPMYFFLCRTNQSEV